MQIKVRAVANSRKPEIIQLSPGEYKVKINAKPVDGAANIRLIEMLSEYFKVPFGSVRIITGSTSKDKVINVG